MIPLPFRSPVAAYERQADELLAGWHAGDADAVQTMRRHYPPLLDEHVPWLPKQLTESELRAVVLDQAAARLALARAYSLQDWQGLVAWVTAVHENASAVAGFESAVEAVIGGDHTGLERQLADDPDLVRARSTFVTCNHPPHHQATLLHYVAANGVEGFRQKTPANAVAIARLLLRAGAAPDALADMYGSRCTTLNMLLSSNHPARAGLQVALAETLLDGGAAIDGVTGDALGSPVMTALAFGYAEAGEMLARRGARVDNLAIAAGRGHLERARELLPAADALTRQRALALAAQHGRTDVLRQLLDAGEAPNRFNPAGTHAHSTPLHQAVCSNNLETVRLLVAHGARLDVRDTVFQSTPLGWAEHFEFHEIADYLRGRDGSRT
jgi:ankyrin repeat protein